MDLVSIVMPCFNDVSYINESIESVLNQTYPNIELIIIDDGSYDMSTINFLYKIDNPKIKMYRYEENKGPSYARNMGIRESRGKYILCLDSDDLIDPTYIEKSVEIMSSNSEVGIVYSRGRYFGVKNNDINLPAFSLDIMKKKNLIFVTALFRKEDWTKVGGFDESLVLGLEDYEFWISILELNRKVVQIPEVLFFYRKKVESRNNVVVNNYSIQKKIINYIRKKHYNFFDGSF